MRIIKVGGLLLGLLLAGGCASHASKMEDAKNLMRYGEYSAAAQELNRVLEADRNRLLREMELGVLYQLQGEYETSLLHLERADRLADELYTQSFSDLLLRSTTNASMVTYRSNIVERVYINYYKMFNYFYMAEQAESAEQMHKLLDSARVEARRALILLDENVFIEGDYEVAAEEKTSVLYQLQQIFAVLNGDVINPRELVFRDNAFTHYMIGSLFEKMGEKSSARVSYERAARLYEQGYRKQYGLDEAVVSQAWLDAVRMMKETRVSSWRRVANSKLDKSSVAQLNRPARGQGQLLVVQEIDMVAPRGELNLWASLAGNRLVIRPVLLGTPEEKAYQLAWFYYLYADKGLLGVVERISADDYIGLLTSYHEKIIPVPDAVLQLLASLGAQEALTSPGIRLSVPMLYYEEQPIKHSKVHVNGKDSSMILAENVSALGMAQHLVAARSELINAMAVETLRLSACAQVMSPSICSLTLMASTSADTRSWLSLPYEVRINRQNLPAGKHQVRLLSSLNGSQLEQTAEVEIAAGELKLLRLRTFAVDPQARLPQAVARAREARLASEAAALAAVQAEQEKKAQLLALETTDEQMLNDGEQNE